VGAFNLMTLAHLTGDSTFADRIERTLRLFGARAAQSGRTVPMALAALSTYHAGMQQIVLAGDTTESLAPLAGVLNSRYLPNAIVVPVTAAHRPRLVQALEWLAPMTPRDGQPTAYVCRNFTCLEPVSSPEALREQIGDRRMSG
jgi:hypothetical protein